MTTEIVELERQIWELTGKLNQLRAKHASVQVKNYVFETGRGPASLLGLAGLGVDNWTSQFGYWSRPGKMDDGGENLVD